MARPARFWLVLALALSLGLAPALCTAALPARSSDTSLQATENSTETPAVSFWGSLWNDLLGWLGLTAGATEDTTATSPTAVGPTSEDPTGLPPVGTEGTDGDDGEGGPTQDPWG